MAICRVIVSKISKMQDVLECSQRISLSVHWRPSRYFFVSRLERFSVRYSNCLVEGHESAWLRKNHAMFSNFFSYPHGPIANFIGQSRCGVEDAGRWESAHCLSPKYVIQRDVFFQKKISTSANVIRSVPKLRRMLTNHCVIQSRARKYIIVFAAFLCIESVYPPSSELFHSKY